ncbi:MAG: hypothetical protein WCA38_16360 [Candidatus Acidiferrales bacterium]
MARDHSVAAERDRLFPWEKSFSRSSHFHYLEAAGASEVNATTSFDRTNYFEKVPSNQLKLALGLESDRMGYLLGTLDQEKPGNQQDVVRNAHQVISNIY